MTDAIEIVVLMSPEEALTTVRKINEHMNSARVLVLDLYERRGWEALGYLSWRECVVSEFSASQSYLYRQLEAAQIEKNISPMGEIGTIPERHLRPLTTLEPAQQIEAWNEVGATAPNGKVTAAHVQTVVDGIRGDGHKPHVAHNSGENEWYTPAWIIEAARAAMGSIDCDPASSSTANQTVKAATFFTAEDDGLGYQWDGNVWLNPPYSKELIGRFVEGVIDRYHAGEVLQACVLVNNATETLWGQALIEASAAVCFLNSRVKFLRPDGSTGAPLQGQMVCYLTALDVAAFIEAFSAYGKVMCHAAR